MNQIINIILILSSILLIIVVMMQTRGTGLGGVFGGSGGVFRTKRGVEKTLFYSTIILSVIFLGSALLNTLI